MDLHGVKWHYEDPDDYHAAHLIGYYRYEFTDSGVVRAGNSEAKVTKAGPLSSFSRLREK